MNGIDNIDTTNNSPLGDGGSSYSNMYYGAPPALFDKAEELRAKMTQAEEIFWNAIKINEWHLKFRRQHPVSTYVVDFYCHAVKLVIELDGGYHEQDEVKRNDTIREQNISDFGITVLRFKNEEILFQLTETIKKIDLIIQQLKRNQTKEPSSSINSPLASGNITILPATEVGASNNSPAQSPDLSGGDGGKLFVIKIGGNIIDDEQKLNRFLNDFAKIRALTKNEGSLNNSPLGDGGKCILVHGGGKIATKIGEQLGIESKYINGRRITDEATISLVTMVYGGLVNKKIVAKLQSLNCDAIGLTGADANIIPATKRSIIYPSPGDWGKSVIQHTNAEKEIGTSNNSPLGDGGKNTSKETETSNNSPLGDGGRDGGAIDYGFAGDINSATLNTKNLLLFLDNGLTPIIAPLTHDGNGQILNTNADTIASSLAVALSKQYDVRLIYCFEKKGILENIEDENSVITLINKEKYKQLLQEKKLFDGILPKIDNAFAAIENGVNEVLIGDANDLLQNITEHTIGTLIK